jgi:hypothetical protein
MESRKFKKGEVVWAKVRGFPWWPGVVKTMMHRISKSQDETKVVVNFIGDNSHANLPLNKVERFMPKYDEYANTKHKALLNSISVAKKIHSGELSYEKHLQYIKKAEESSDSEEEASVVSSSELIEDTRDMKKTNKFLSKTIVLMRRT